MEMKWVKTWALGALLTAVLAVVVAGCGALPAVGPDYQEPALECELAPLPDAGYPATNSEAAVEAEDVDPRAELTAEQLVAWWNQFDDPVLTGLIEGAVTNNLSFLMAKERLAQARWRLLGSAAPLFPQIALGGTAEMLENHRTTSAGSSAGRDLHHDYFKGGFDATWEIDLFGGVRRGVEAAMAGAEAAEYGLAATWVSLTAEIATQYIMLRTTQQRLGVARANLKLQSETYDILKSRLDSGIGDELAVNQAKYNVEQTRAGIPELLAAEEALKNALAVLAGEMPGALHEALAELPERDWLVEPQKLSEIPLNALRLRPDVKAAERALAAQVAAVGVATSMFYPKLYINGSLGLESLKFDKLFHRSSLLGAIGPSFSWPLFQGGNILANEKVEEAKMEEALLGYEAALQNACADVRNAYSAYTWQYHRFQALQRAVKAAQDAEAISQDLYKNGLADFNNVLDAQRSLLSLEESFTVSRGNITLELIALYKALGGGLSVAR